MFTSWSMAHSVVYTVYCMGNTTQGKGYSDSPCNLGLRPEMETYWSDVQYYIIGCVFNWINFNQLVKMIFPGGAPSSPSWWRSMPQNGVWGTMVLYTQLLLHLWWWITDAASVQGQDVQHLCQPLDPPEQIITRITIKGWIATDTPTGPVTQGHCSLRMSFAGIATIGITHPLASSWAIE